MEKGWVKFYRRILENSFLMNDNNACLVFMKILLLVGQEKGEWAGGRRQLAEIMNLNDRTLYGVLVRLENNGIIKIESKVRYSVITVENWHMYQNKPNGGQRRSSTDRSTLGKQRSFDSLATDLATTTQPQRNHNATTTQHSNKNKKEEKEKESRDFKKSGMSPAQRKSYFLSMEKEREQEMRQVEARARPRTRGETINRIIEREWR